MFGLSFWEIAMVLLVALVVLGPKRLPELARTVGKTLRSLRRASSDIRSAIEEPLREVREPLEEMRQDLYQSVHNFEEQVERAIDREETEVRAALAATSPDPGAEPPEVEEAPVLDAEGEDSNADTVDLPDGPLEADESGRVTADPALLAASFPSDPEASEEPPKIEDEPEKSV